MGPKPTAEQQLSLQDRRRRLDSKIESFSRHASTYIGTINVAPSSQVDCEWFDEDDDSDMVVPAGLTRSEIPTIVEGVFAEHRAIPLPSSFGAENCATVLRHLAESELQLRIGQANDALHLLRVAIAQKSFIYRTTIRPNAPTTNYSKRLRSYGDARAVQKSIDSAAKIYSTARKAMEILGASDATLGQFKILKKEDLAASTAVSNPNARQQSKKPLSWIWHQMSASEDPKFVQESKHYRNCILPEMCSPLDQCEE